VVVEHSRFVEFQDGDVVVHHGRSVVAWMLVDLLYTEFLKVSIVPITVRDSRVNFEISVEHSICAVSSSNDGVGVDQGTSAQKLPVEIHRYLPWPCAWCG